jgi:hypothetical protein
MQQNTTDQDATNLADVTHGTPHSLAGGKATVPSVSDHLDAYQAYVPQEELDPTAERRVMMLAAVVLGVVTALALGLALVVLESLL